MKKADKLQSLKDKLCCCEEKLAGFTGNTVDYVVAGICDAISNSVVFLFHGQSGGQPDFAVPINNLQNGSFQIPSWATGNYTLRLMAATNDGDGVQVFLYTANNVQLGGTIIGNGSGYFESTPFNIQSLDHVAFGCNPGG